MEYTTIEGSLGDASSTSYDKNGAHTVTNNVLHMGVPAGVIATHTEDLLDQYKSPYSRDSFTAIRRSGEIKMTDYEHRKTTEFRPLVRIRHVLANRSGNYSGDDRNTTGVWASQDYDTVIGHYDRLTHFEELVSNGTSYERMIPPEDLTNEVLGNVVSEAATSLDLLTEFKERQGTFMLLLDALEALRRPLQSYKDKVDSVRRRYEGIQGYRRHQQEVIAAWTQEASDLWLKYRYGIMPLVYTVNDLLKVLESHHGLYLTDRSRLTSYGKSGQPRGETCLWDVGQWVTTYRAVSKGRFATSKENLLTQLSINHITTAWELVPYSFVVDWVINVGAWLESLTFNVFDLASERKFCVSIRTRAEYETHYRTKTPGIPEFVLRDVVAPHGIMHVYPAIPGKSTTVLVRKVKIDSYQRRVAEAGDVELALQPYMDWKRWVDSFALLSKPLINSLRRLRK